MWVMEAKLNGSLLFLRLALDASHFMLVCIENVLFAATEISVDLAGE